MGAKKMARLISLLALLFLLARPAEAYDLRPRLLATFLAKQKSLLAFFAQDFVDQADVNGLDFRLLVAISGVESTFGKNYIPGSYNVYGWGKGQISFSSWPDGIAKVSAALRQNYLNKRAVSIAQIARIYDPPGAEIWASGVTYFLNQIGP